MPRTSCEQLLLCLGQVRRQVPPPCRWIYLYVVKVLESDLVTPAYGFRLRSNSAASLLLHKHHVGRVLSGMQAPMPCPLMQGLVCLKLVAAKHCHSGYLGWL